MKILCEFAQGNNNASTILCMAGNKCQPCTKQRYCTQACEWQNTNAFSTCERRKINMAKMKDIQEHKFDKPILEEQNDIVESTEQEVKETVKDIPPKAKDTVKVNVIAVSDVGAVISYKNSNYFIKGVKAKVGDWIDFEPK